MFLAFIVKLYQLVYCAHTSISKALQFRATSQLHHSLDWQTLCEIAMTFYVYL